MNRKLQIAVLGSSRAICTKKAYKLAEQVGEEIALNNCITISGGGLGVMEACMKGAKKKGGTTVAIIPWENIHKSNEYSDIVIATGIGWSRDAINLNSCDGAIVVHGGAGTLNEVTYGYISKKPIVALTSSGGTAADISGKYLDVRKNEKIIGAKNPKEAVEKILKIIAKRNEQGLVFSEFDKDLLMMEDKEDWEIIIKRKKKN
ncbi:MAG: TIGR00725 family protein [Nanoarchaeota archaeon]|nr:TIGR00725 family protein [Nanoarchaeota archaeon]